MGFNETICRIRKKLNMTQEQFADEFNVSKQAVQKWEKGTSCPDISKVIEISRRFDISLDTLLLDKDMRAIEEQSNPVIPDYSSMPDYEEYSSAMLDEYAQSYDEGLDIEMYKDIFNDISKLPKGEIKKKFGDVIFDIVINAKQRKDYKYIEPSELSQIKELRREGTTVSKAAAGRYDKILGAWMGRICGCMLGKTVEGIHTDELIPFLKATNNYPMRRYILKTDADAVDTSKYSFQFENRLYADTIDGMPMDDDTNYTVLAQVIIDKYGRDFTPRDVAQAWLQHQSKDAYFTAERVAYCNFIKGYMPPNSAVHKNPYREWIGAQIRTDYYGYINPGNPELAADMACRDASVSHVKNGIYGAMFVSAMLAAAGVTNDIEEIILAGLSQIPYTSRLHEEVMSVLEGYKTGVPQEECFNIIHTKYDEHTGYGWCHTNSNAMIVAAALLYGGGDYGRSVCMAVETGFDTDCNGATVGSVLGMANGIESIPKYWTEPIKDTLHTSVFGIGTTKISELAKNTLKHIEK